MPKLDFRGDRFTKKADTFRPPPPPRSIIPQPLADLGAGKEPKPEGGAAAFCRNNPVFQGGAVSESECYIYYALLVITKTPDGGGVWSYQVNILGGHHIAGGHNVDFVVYTDISEGHTRWIGIRLQSYEFHQHMGSFKQQSDEGMLIDVEHYGMRVVDIYEQDFINAPDPGAVAIFLVYQALQGEERPNPLASGMSLPV